MSGTHINKEARARMKAALVSAAIEIDVDGTSTAVKVLSQLPANFVIQDEDLPALYVLQAAETRTHEEVSETQHHLTLDVVCMAAQGGAGDPQDQLDDLQLAVELAIIGSGNLGGLATECRLTGSELTQNQGNLMIGVRALHYRVTLGVTPADPSL
jgi:hypothetical protein